jgi:hypothetical protein
MNSEAPIPSGDEPKVEIVLIDVAGHFYLVEGEEYLSQLMLVDGTFPKPVRCVKFEDIFDLSAFTGGTANLADLWAINPEIISRLRNDGHLLEIDASE